MVPSASPAVVAFCNTLPPSSGQPGPPGGADHAVQSRFPASSTASASSHWSPPALARKPNRLSNPLGGSGADAPAAAVAWYGSSDPASSTTVPTMWIDESPPADEHASAQPPSGPSVAVNETRRLSLAPGAMGSGSLRSAEALTV